MQDQDGSWADRNIADIVTWIESKNWIQDIYLHLMHDLLTTFCAQIILSCHSDLSQPCQPVHPSCIHPLVIVEMLRRFVQLVMLGAF